MFGDVSALASTRSGAVVFASCPAIGLWMSMLHATWVPGTDWLVGCTVGVFGLADAVAGADEAAVAGAEVAGEAVPLLPVAAQAASTRVAKAVTRSIGTRFNAVPRSGVT
jgi:hypothetical protein